VSIIAGLNRTITPGQQLNLSLPQGGNQYASLVLDNLSTFLLQIGIGARTYWHAPLVENAYDLVGMGGQPVTVGAFQLAPDTSASGTLAPTWYGGDDLPPSRNWPIALSGPAEVAAATASALLASGIPNVMTTTDLGVTSAPPSPPTTTVDVHQYSELIVVPLSIPSGTLQFSFSPTIGGGSLGTFTFDPGSAAASVPVLAQYLNLTNSGAATAAVQIYGTNQSAPRAFGVGGSTLAADGIVISTGVVAMVAGTDYPLTPIGTSPDTGGLGDGLISLYLQVDDSVPVHGQLYSYNAITGKLVVITDTNNLGPALPVIGRSKNLLIGATRNLGNFRFRCTASGTTNVTANLMPAQL
jgi:hypothetical protein